MLDVEVANQQSQFEVDPPRLAEMARKILQDAGIRQGEISIAIVDNPTIHRLNRQYLSHDYATDVLSFVLDRHADRLNGEIIVSVEMASENAVEYGWSTSDELMLYVIHAALHLIGHDDKDPVACQQMRAQEDRYLAVAGLSRRTADSN